MHRYRSHTCAALRKSDVGPTVRLSGWVHRVRDHGGLLFIDLRDHYGMTQIVVDPDSPGLQGGRDGARRMGHPHRRRRQGALGRDRQQAAWRPARSRLYAQEIEVLSAAKELPLPVFGEPDYPEDIRLKYRFLDLRRETLHKNIVKRSQIISDMRRAHGLGRLRRIFDADPDGVLAGRRARLPGAEPHPSRQVLRAAAGAAAVQAAVDGGRFRPLLPDRARASATKTRAPTACRANSTSSTSK